METKQGKMNLEDIRMNLQENWRGTGNLDLDYGIPTMVQDILAAGRIQSPVHVEEKTGELLRGFRRINAAIRIVADPQAPKDVVKNLQKLDVVLVSGLSPAEKLAYRYDDGGFKRLSRSEIASAYFKFRKNMFDVAQIIPIMFQSLAVYTGKTDKAGKVESLRGEERTKFLRTWFKGTVDQYFEYAYDCGPLVQEQLILTERAKERELTDEEKKRKVFDMTRDRCKELYDAKKKGKGELDALIKKYEAIDKGEQQAPPSDKGLTKSQIKTQADAAGSKYRKATLASVLEGEDALKARLDQGRIDAELSALESFQEVARQRLDAFKKVPQVYAVLMCIAFPTPENVAKATEALASK